MLAADSPDSFVNAICFATSASVTVFRFTAIARSKSLIVNGGSRSSSDPMSVHVFSMAPGAPGEQGVSFVTVLDGSSLSGTSTCG